MVVLVESLGGNRIAFIPPNPQVFGLQGWLNELLVISPISYENKIIYPTDKWSYFSVRGEMMKVRIGGTNVSGLEIQYVESEADLHIDE